MVDTDMPNSVTDTDDVVVPVNLSARDRATIRAALDCWDFMLSAEFTRPSQGRVRGWLETATIKGAVELVKGRELHKLADMMA